MVDPYTAGRRMERLIGSDAYNNTERYQEKIRDQQPILTPENSIPIGYSITNTKTGKIEFIRYIRDESGNIVDPKTGKIIRENKDISKKVKKENSK